MNNRINKSNNSNPNTKLQVQKTMKKMQKHWERQVKERDMFRDILEVQTRSAKLNFWEEDEDISSSEDIYSQSALLSEDDDLDPITAGVMLGFITA